MLEEEGGRGAQRVNVDSLTKAAATTEGSEEHGKRAKVKCTSEGSSSRRLPVSVLIGGPHPRSTTPSLQLYSYFQQQPHPQISIYPPWLELSCCHVIRAVARKDQGGSVLLWVVLTVSREIVKMFIVLRGCGWLPPAAGTGCSSSHISVWFEGILVQIFNQNLGVGFHVGSSSLDFGLDRRPLGNNPMSFLTSTGASMTL